MKRITLACIMLFSITIFAQQGINYKALIKDGVGNVVANQSITVQFQILQGAGMTNVYQETHTPTTDANGFVIVNIGEGSVDSGVFVDIDWGSDEHFLNVQIDTGGGLTDMGTTQFMAVPYALYAESVKTCDLAIGDTHAGGIIFYLDATGCHGLVCAPTDQSDGVVAYLNGSLTATFESGIGVGEMNTLSIVGQFGEGDYAAKLCYDLVLDGYDDWYLPSRYEAMLMFYNIGGGAEAPNTNIGGFTDEAYYWTSTEIFFEIGNEIAVFEAFLGIYSNPWRFDSWQRSFTYSNNVRAIRSF